LVTQGHSFDFLKGGSNNSIEVTKAGVGGVAPAAERFPISTQQIALLYAKFRLAT